MISKQEINFQDFGEDEIESIVFDFGSDMIKAGFAGENSPRVILRTIVGRQKYIGIMTGGMGGKDTYIGEEAISKRGILNLKCPLEKGMIINWDDMEKVWHHTFYNELRIAPEEHPFLFSEFFLNPKKHQEKITEIMFEIFEVPAFYSEKSELFSLISSGKRTGLMIQSGHDLSYCVSIFEGEILNDSFTQLNLAGKSITEYLIKLVNQREGYSFTTFGEKEIVRDMKEKICYVALDFEEEMNKHENIIQKDYELPDGQIIQIGKERFQSAECLFQPSLIGIEENGIHKIAYDAITKTENELRKEVIENIVLTGGTSMFPGFNERLEKEMNQLMEKEEKINVIASPQRKYSVWIGGAIFASRPGFLNLCISSQDYNEFGPTIIHKRKQNNFF